MRQLVSKIRHYISVYFSFVRMSMLVVFTYRINAFLMGLAPIVWMGIQMIFIAVIFSKANSLGGWKAWEVVFLTGIHEILFLLVWTTCLTNLRTMIKDIRRGRFDMVLLRPISPRFLASFRGIDITAVGSFFNTFALIIFSAPRVLIGIPPFRYFVFIILLIFSYLIGYFLYFTASSLVFRFIAADKFVDWVLELTDFDRFPADVYAKSVKAFLSMFLPILFFAYFPTAYLLGKVDARYFLFSFVAVVIFGAISQFVWKDGLRHYQSTGS